MATNKNEVQDGQQIKSSVRRSNIFNEFFWICSGANRHILRQCPTEYSKYFGIGGTIFFTAAMAWISGGYAMSMIFDDLDSVVFWGIKQSTLMGVLFGLFWGLLIFNLDRFMVNTMYSDGTHKITKEELKGGLPRLVLACFIGIVISTPIELRIFKDKIDEQLLEDRKVLAESQYGPRKRELNADIDKLNAEIRNLDSINTELQDAIDKAWNDYDEERTGRGGTGKIGYGPNAQSRETYYNSRREQNAPRIQRNNERIAEIENNIDAKRSELDQIETLINELTDNSNHTKGIGFNSNNDISKVKSEGFADRLNAFNTITTDFEHNGAILFIARLLIMLLFVAIEIIPTLFKLMMTSGPYDELLNEEMHRKKVLSIQSVSNLNAEVNTQIQIKTEKEKQRLETELAANKQLLEKIAAVQAELLETAVDEWRKAELQKIKADPSQYIQSNTTKA